MPHDESRTEPKKTTGPLPESQRDRFLQRISLGYPHRKAERELREKGDRKSAIETIPPVPDTDQVMAIRGGIARIHISDPFGNDLIARQSGAHAWAEGWLPGRGCQRMPHLRCGP